MEAVLSIKGLTKRYGRQVALAGLNMMVPKGCVAAFVGANGAGKTTTFSVVGSFIRADAGFVEVCGFPLSEYRRRGGVIGLLPQDVQLFESRTLDRQLFLFARLSGLSAHSAKYEVSRLLDMVDLADKAAALPSDLSHGMRVRFGVAQALVGNPPLVLLDEPTAGLDPKMIAGFRELIERIRGKTTIVISSHDLTQLEIICDWVCMIDHGLIVQQGPLGEMLANTSNITFRLAVEGLNLDSIRRQFPELAFSQDEPSVLVVCFDPRRMDVPKVNAMIMAYLCQHGVGVLEIESRRSLESLYFEGTK